jgi:hypothetical protein
LNSLTFNKLAIFILKRIQKKVLPIFEKSIGKSIELHRNSDVFKKFFKNKKAL